MGPRQEFRVQVSLFFYYYCYSGSPKCSPVSATPRKELNFQYAGLIAEISPSIDPSGRTDLLSIIDEAEWRSEISTIHCQNNYVEDARLAIDCDSLVVSALDDGVG